MTASPDKRKFALWLTPDTREEVRFWYKEDNCRSQSEFIEKAIHFYCGYLAADSAGDYLPHILGSLWAGQFDHFADRVTRQLFNLAVEEAILCHLIAADTDIDFQSLDELRGRCVNELKRGKGQLGFRDALRYVKEA